LCILAEPKNPRWRLELAVACLAAGDESRARDAVLRGRAAPTADPDILRRWGEICEELGMVCVPNRC
jgi:hypothetical protein